jgi:hypothetical protein
MATERPRLVKGLWRHAYCLNCHCLESHELPSGSLRGSLLCCAMLCYAILSLGEEPEALGSFVRIVHSHVACLERCNGSWCKCIHTYASMALPAGNYDREPDCKEYSLRFSVVNCSVRPAYMQQGDPTNASPALRCGLLPRCFLEGVSSASSPFPAE